MKVWDKGVWREATESEVRRYDTSKRLADIARDLADALEDRSYSRSAEDAKLASQLANELHQAVSDYEDDVAENTKPNGNP